MPLLVTICMIYSSSTVGRLSCKATHPRLVLPPALLSCPVRQGERYKRTLY